MRAIIFDFDGTIADSFQTVVQIAHEMTHRDQLVQPEELARLRKLRLVDVARDLKIPRWRWPFLLMRGRRKMSKRLHAVPVFPGIDGVLAAGQHDSYQLFIVSSNSRGNVEKFLSEHGLGSYFTRIYGSVGFHGKGKVLRKILKAHHLKPSEAIYVGDEPRDIASAREVDMPCVAVAWGFNTAEVLAEHNPMVIVRTTEQLRRVLEEWGSSFS